MTFPGFPELFQLRDPLNQRAFRGQLVDQGNPWDQAWIRAENLPDRVVTLRHAMGSQSPQSCIWTTSQALVVHKRVIEELTRAQITGWTTYVVRLSMQGGLRNEAGDYVGFAVVGRCGELDYSKSEWINWKSSVGTDISVLRGIGFDPASWDGSDFFAPSTRGLLKVLCTAAGRAALSRFGNVEFTALTDIETEKASLPPDAKLPPS
jgi:hypothetical protein